MALAVLGAAFRAGLRGASAGAARIGRSVLSSTRTQGRFSAARIAELRAQQSPRVIVNQFVGSRQRVVPVFIRDILPRDQRLANEAAFALARIRRFETRLRSGLRRADAVSGDLADVLEPFAQQAYNYVVENTPVGQRFERHRLRLRDSVRIFFERPNEHYRYYRIGWETGAGTGIRREQALAVEYGVLRSHGGGITRRLSNEVGILRSHGGRVTRVVRDEFGVLRRHGGSTARRVTDEFGALRSSSGRIRQLVRDEFGVLREQGGRITRYVRDEFGVLRVAGGRVTFRVGDSVGVLRRQGATIERRIRDNFGVLRGSGGRVIQRIRRNEFGTLRTQGGTVTRRVNRSVGVLRSHGGAATRRIQDRFGVARRHGGGILHQAGEEVRRAGIREAIVEDTTRALRQLINRSSSIQIPLRGI